MDDDFDGREFVGEQAEESPCMAKLDRLPWVVHRSFRLNGEAFGVRTNSREMGRWLDRTLGAYRTDERTSAYFSLYVAPESPTGSAGIRRFHILYRGTIAGVRSFDVDTLRRTFLDELESFLASARDDAIFLHAVLALHEGMYVLMSRALATFLDDGRRRLLSIGTLATPSRWVAVDRDTAAVTPVPHRLEVPAEVRDGLNGFDQDGREGRLRVAEPVRPQMVLSFGAEGPALVPITRGRALLHLATATMNFPRAGPSSLYTLKQLVEGTTCYRLAPAPPAEAIRAFQEAVSSATVGGP